jgi:methyl-accepting chemotaxis protein
MSDEQHGHGLSRLDRMEGLMQLLIDDHLKFSGEHKRLLTAQVLLTENVDKLANTTGHLAEMTDRLTQRMDALAATTDKLAQRMDELAEAQKHTDQRMDALIAVVDGMIRKPPGDLTTD